MALKDTGQLEVVGSSPIRGCGSEKVIHPFKGQIYKRLKAECIKESKLFVDNVFPASSKSLYYSHSPPCEITWKRPGEIVTKPSFVREGIDTDDLSQGALGNCWFVAACACIAQDRKLLNKVVPDLEDQEWDDKRPYAGIFHFHFWWTGQWLDVVIDDFLPTKRNRLLYVHSKDKREFWSALLEKAYAKLFGCYEGLIAGKARDALVNMTGGVAEGVTLEDLTNTASRMKFFDDLEESYEHGSLMSASIAPKETDEVEAKMSCGLIKGHAYSITSVKRIRVGKGMIAFFKNEVIYMLRLRNPWGGVEWNGPWSDGSAEWKNVNGQQKKAMGLEFDDNGEFWMTFGDFCRFFTHIDTCHIFNTSFLSLKKKWCERTSTRIWRNPGRAGGCLNFATFLNNHQYLLAINDDDTKLMMSIEQEDRRALLKSDAKNFVVGITITETDLNRRYRMHQRGERVHAGPFIEARNALTHVTLKNGFYLVVPSTFHPGQEGEFIFRVYSKSNFELVELDRDEPPPPPSCFHHRYLSAVAITAVKAEGLGKSVANCYCLIKCEGKDARTKNVESANGKPRWNAKATFYRKKPDSDIFVEVWDDKRLQVDDFLGCTEVLLDQHHVDDEVLRYPLYRKCVSGKVPAQGYIWIQAKLTLKLDEV